jgi:tetratricopeptide (TPR) repeat protein
MAGPLALSEHAFADNKDKAWASKVVSLQGRVLVKRHGDDDWQPARLSQALFGGDSIRVEANSRAGIVLSNDAVLRLDQSTTLMFTQIEQPATFIFRMLKGAASFFSHRPRSLKILTPFVNGVVEGTEFFVRVDTDQTRIELFEGRVRAENPYGELQLAKGQGAVASEGSAPQRMALVRPRESVQWALYYPPVLVLGPDQASEALETALTLFNQGRISEAIDASSRVEPHARDARYFVFHAALLLHVGRVHAALGHIERALVQDPDNGDAVALQAIINVVQNRQPDALAAALLAVQKSPRSAAAHIALSYAHQAGFSLSEALQAARAAVTYAPENGTAWARLAELQLSTGELSQAIASARKAVALNPGTARAYTVLGFSYLTRIKTSKARDAFNRAAVLDSAAPLPRLGLGLAAIRDGNLARGRGQIEIAAGLDPANALIRSYLGKAYFDEKRDPQDGRQYEIAKSLDPNDPTPWLYDAIRKQTLNRPVEALQDLQKSIELNDNRAVYRSRLLLDEDLAARSAGLGRIYNDLDFQHLALLQGYRSLGADSTNYSAHRLLADTYAAKPRHEIARVSELLQSQLFQPLNLTPIQARLAEAEALSFEGAGPASPSFNEYNPLFMRNRLALQAGGLTGGERTRGADITGAGIFDQVSASCGAFRYRSDGFRVNNDTSQKLIDLFIQGALTPNTSLQGQYHYSQKEYGDISQNFDGGFSETQRNKRDDIKTRLGARHVFSPQLEVIASYIHSKWEFIQDDMQPTDPFNILVPSVFQQKIKGDLYEVRADWQRDRFGLIAGFSYMEGTLFEDWRLELFPGVELPIIDGVEADFERDKVYAYSNLGITSKATLMLGLSADSIEFGSLIDRNQVNPKLGLTLHPHSNTTLRLAAFRVLASTYEFKQTTEPTQVAGFNQFFDDLNASEVSACGAAVDQTFSKRLFGGVEFLYRDLDVPQVQTAPRLVNFSDWVEQTGLAYIGWAPVDRFALRVEYQYERFDREDSPRFGIVNIDTQRVPISLSIFHPSGLSCRTSATYFYQEGEFIRTGNIESRFQDSDNFWILDAEASYRLPKRWGRISIGIKNMLDEEFHYTETDPSNPAVVPGILAFVKMTLSF